MDEISSCFRNPIFSNIQIYLFGLFREIKYYIVDKITRITKVRKYKYAKVLKLNLGCGIRKKKGFINIDIHKNVDLRLDLRKQLPFSNDSVDYIFSEGFFSYLNYKDGTAIRALQDYRRVLKNGAQIRMVIPNHEQFFKAYINKDIEYFKKFVNIQPYIPQKKEYISIIDYINFCLEYGKIGYAFDFEKISLLLKSVGFKNINKDKFNPNKDVNIKIRELFSLYIEAEK